jgi:hypothetical protein
MTKPKDSVSFCGSKLAKGRKGTCRQIAGAKTDHPGSGHCWLHGGATPAGELYAERQAATRRLAAFGYQIDIDPHEALLLCIRLAAGEVQAATEQVEKLEEGEILVHPWEELERPLKEEKGGENPGIRVTETRKLKLQLNTWVEVRQQATDRLVRYSAAAVKAGLEERLVRVAEIQGQLMASAVRGILEDLGVADHPDAPKVVRRHLTAIAERSESGAIV